MLIIIAVSIILLLPVISYLLQPLSNQKSIVFLITFLIYRYILSHFLKFVKYYFCLGNRFKGVGGLLQKH